LGFSFFNNGYLNEISVFIFRGLLFPADLFKTYKVYNIFGNPILQLNLILWVNVVIAVILAYLTYLSFRRRQVY
jgi:hypothetical protein